jgi:serine/threonine-protein phosphatase 2B regulatory subunit
MAYNSLTMGAEGSGHTGSAAPSSKKPKAGKKRSKGVVEPTAQEYTALSGETKFSESELRRLWIKFNALSNSQVADGKIDLTEFQSALGLKSEGFAQRVFAAFDHDGSQEIDFPEFCRGLYAMSPRASLEDKAKFCFSVYDIDGNGEIDREELRSILMYSLSENSAVKLSDDQLRRIIDRTYDKMDKNGDGGISFEEFRMESTKNPAILACVNVSIDQLLGGP